ncbi:MAG: hypothetical protein ABI867_14975 [Kofleriaceae bacterium]
MPTPIERWLAARDAESVRSAWTALEPRRHEVAGELSRHGAALLAGAMLGERADWIVDTRSRKPELEIQRVVDVSYFDDAWDVHVTCEETWKLHEHRGVQIVHLVISSLPGEQPGGSDVTVVRVVDGARAASIVIGSTKVSTIGDIDLAPLDLYRFGGGVASVPSPDAIDTARGLIAQVAAEVDAHYDTSALWPRKREGEFGDDERWIAVKAFDGAVPYTSAMVHGLPWGHELEIILPHDGRPAFCKGRLPAADRDRVLARLT